MSRSYREAMEHIQVTPAMRERILQNLSRAEKQPAKKAGQLIPWKQVLSLAACAAVLVVGVTALPHSGELGSSSESGLENNSESIVSWQEGMVGTAAPAQEYTSLEALSAAAGFAVQEPQKLPFAVQETSYTLLFGELAQVEQTGAEGEKLLYRVSQEAGDNSGDYTIYSVEEQQTIGGVIVMLKGDADGFRLAVWQEGTFSYSLSSSQSLSLKQMQALIESVQA